MLKGMHVLALKKLLMEGDPKSKRGSWFKQRLVDDRKYIAHLAYLIRIHPVISVDLQNLLHKAVGNWEQIASEVWNDSRNTYIVPKWIL